MTRDRDQEWPLFFDRLLHDFREPLRAVQSFSELLRETSGSSLNADGNQAIDEILAGSGRLRILLDSLSKFAWTLEQDPEHETGKGSSLQLALDMAVMAMDEPIASSGATVIGENLPRVRMGLPRLARLMENLLANSLLFRSETPPRVEVTAREDSGDPERWLIEVADNGIGIEPGDCEAVFRPFVRIHGRKYPGAGLGLSACRNLVENCGGSIWMESGVEKGNVCRVRLPKA
jgi:signal transduction histidine kinase